nr:rapid alkalinization factor-like [Ipomoea trifida]
MAIKVSQLVILHLLVGNLVLSVVAASGGDAKEMMVDSESSRRALFQYRYLSYSVLQKDKIPCGRRGPSYYNCHIHRPIRPYTRGCSRFTRCGGRGR